MIGSQILDILQDQSRPDLLMYGQQPNIPEAFPTFSNEEEVTSWFNQATFP